MSKDTSVASASIGRPIARYEDRFARLYEAHSEGALRYAFVLTNDQTMAEDLVQEAFIKVFAHFGDRREPRSFVAYLRRTILNLARSQARRRKSEITFVQSVRVQDVVAAPETMLDDELWTAIQRLPIRQRSVVFFRYHLDMKEEDVAEAMGCSIGAVKSLMLRAKRALRDVIEEERHGSAG